MGLAPESFDRMTFAEFVYAQQGYIRRVEQQYQTAMNVERWGTFAIMSVIADLGGASAYEVLPLPWDEEARKHHQTKSDRISASEMKRRRAEALKMIKLLEENEQDDSQSFN